MSRQLRIIVRWPRPLRRGVAVALSGVVISIVSLVGVPHEGVGAKSRAVLQIELRAAMDTSPP